MRNVLSASGRAELLKKIHPGHTLLAFDFDGTLAPIEMNPDDAYTPETTARLVRQLRRRYMVAVISGRSIADLHRRLRFEPDYLVGNHGAEELPDFSKHGPRADETCRKWVKALNPVLDHLGERVFHEDKRYSLSLHYRHASRRSVKALKEQILRLRPAPHLIEGKEIYNLLPRFAPHKGKALRTLLDHTGVSTAVFVGDDITDEYVFNLHDRRVFSVKVGRSSRSSAPYFVPRQIDVSRLLENLP